jgi:hypothetical protein
MDSLSSLYSDILDLWVLVFLFVVAIIASSLGAIAGIVTRNVMILICLGIAVIAVIIFHQHLPLPPEVHRQLDGLKNHFR